MARIVDAPSLPTYDLGPEHPFRRDRQLPLFDLMDRLQLIRDDERLRCAPLDADELTTVHDAMYVEVLQRLNDTTDVEALRRAPLHGLGSSDNPIHPNQHSAAAAAAAGTVTCVDEVLEGHTDAAFNPAGGLHHAMPNGAAGFCIYNDLALGIVAARQRGVRRVAYIDFDVHHGDGVEYVFRSNPDVLTISFHEDPAVRYPGTGYVRDRGHGDGVGAAINVPFASGTGDASWQHLVREVLTNALERFQPELIVTQHGCDPHATDPLADLMLTTDSFRFSAEISRELAARHCAGKWVATGGGGYRPFTVIPRAWSSIWAVMAQRELPTNLPSDWRQRWQEAAGSAMPDRFEDEPIADSRTETAAGRNLATLDTLARDNGW